MAIVYRPFELAAPLRSVHFGPSHLRHPIFAWLGLRPVYAQHTLEENEALRRWARGKKALVEIGVAEGASALALRQVMHSEAVLYLIDPYHLSRFPLVNSEKRLARNTVADARNGRVEWLEKFSHDASQTWTEPIDFLFVDGDHSEDAVQQDWTDWHQFVAPDGIVVFHDARVFAGGWTTPTDGPVTMVNGHFRNGRLIEWEIVDEVHSLVIIRRGR